MDSEFFQVLARQIGQDREIDVILDKAPNVLPEVTSLEPIRRGAGPALPSVNSSRVSSAR
jgi:hypothetical protein